MMDQIVDRISGLPPFIIHHIMSYLSAKEVARISILSKRWSQLRISFPIFDFDQTNFLTEDESVEILGFRENNGRLKEFMEFVDASLLRFCELTFCMHKFRLFLSILYVEESTPYIDKWIGLAIEKGVKEFGLEFLEGGETPYTLPQTIFSAWSVTTLKLVFCKLENISDTIRFNSLRKLSLDRVVINEEMVQRLSSECPLLEEMFFSQCWGLKQLCVSRALKLKIMDVSFCEIESVEIVVPNLQELVLEFDEEIMPRVIDITSCSQLKKLKFWYISLKEQQFHHFISSFPLLEDLILEGCYYLERITISSDQLKKFQVISCHNMKALDLDTPNLLSFTYMDSPVPTSCINALCPWQIECYPIVTFDTQWCLKLREFIEVSNQIEVLRISESPTLSSFELEEFKKNFISSFTLEEFKKSSPSPSYNVGNLELQSDMALSEYMILLDCLLWICYPKTLSLRTSSCKAEHKLFESFYNELKNRDVSCCNSHINKCWRHYLKDIKVKSFQDTELIEVDNLMKLLSIDNLSDLWSILPPGIIKFHLDWCFPVSTENA